MRISRPHPRIRVRLFAYFAVITLAVALAVYLCLYITMMPSLKDTAYATLRETARTHMNAMDQWIRTLNGVSVNIAYSARIRALIERINEQGKLPYDILRELTDHLVTVNGPMFPVAQIRLYSLNGVVVTAGMVNGQYDYDPAALPWMEKVLSADGSKVLSLPEKDGMLVKTSYYVALRRVIKQNYRQPIGIIEVVADVSKMFGGLSPETSTQIYLVNGAGETVFPLHAASPPFAEEVLNSPDLSGIVERDAELIAWRKSSECDWALVAVQSRSDVLKPLNTMTRITILSVSGLLVLALVMSYLVARQFTRPIRALADRMTRFNLSEQEEGPADASDLDELVALNDSFGRLTARLGESVEEVILSKQQELQSHMIALQSQMNPHFLHNMLSNLEALIDLGENDRAIHMIATMSRMLRYIASDAETVVPLEDELQNVRDYIDCMQIRFGKNLTYSIDMDEAVRSITVPKLSIQPLVENAIKYGCTAAPPWHIRVEIRISDSNWKASVYDDGPGFDGRTLAALLAGIDEVRKKGVLPGMQIGGMGLLNIAMRLKLYVGDDFLFHIQNLDGGGCVLTIGSCRGGEEA